MHRTCRALLLLLPLLSLSCTTAAGLRRAELRRALDQARLSRSPAEIWPELQRFLHQRGFPLVGNDPTALGLPAQGTVGRLFSSGHETRVRADGSRILETNLESRSRTRVRAEALASQDADIARANRIATSPAVPYRGFPVEFMPVQTAFDRLVAGGDVADAARRIALLACLADLAAAAAMWWGWGRRPAGSPPSPSRRGW